MAETTAPKSSYAKVTVLQDLYQKLNQDSEGRYSTGLTVQKINSSGTFTPDRGDKAGQEVPYSKDKIQIILSKLDYKTGAVKHIAKIGKSGDPYSMPDQVKVQMEIETFKEFLFNASDILEELT